MSGGVIASAFMVAESDGKVPTKFQKTIVGENAEKTMETKEIQPSKEYKWDIAWLNIVLFAIMHISALYGWYLYFTVAKTQSIIIYWVFTTMGGMGITGGAHRLWAHRTYKAKLPMRILLMLMNCVAHQNTIYEWARDHRAHHKYTDTDADPHNSKRGFFFSHMGWLVVRKHPDVTKRGKGIDMSDLENDPVVVFQMKYFWILMPLLCFILPTLIPVYFWNESLRVAFFITMQRYATSLHWTWLVNSAAHLWGFRPYDKSISPTENWFVALLTYGEGWHNYHHAFPWDYKTAELHTYWLNLTTLFIDIFASLGLAYDLKAVSMDMVKKRAEKTGDGSWKMRGERKKSDKGEVWGWGDKDMRTEDKEVTTILARGY